ncbi:hypothetical protein I302_104382 [Kwoniella bestiolae CBS 10118]|uniref:Pentatricopeptide repeat protein n=1 Tax=Kwoniella bestiolae CBS 10118 TaxID=1296100 RepID=A0AAJ8K7T1_9TREE
MQAARRSTALLRHHLFPSASLLQPALVREYHGDPGPSTRSHRSQNDLRSTLVSASKTGQGASSSGRHLPRDLVNADRQTIDRILDIRPPSTFRIGRKGEQRGAALPLRLPNPSSGKARYDGERQDAYSTSIKLRKLIEKYTRAGYGVNKPLSDLQIQEAIQVVVGAPKDMVNAPVWNILLGFMGKQRRLNQMWSLYNDMKKRGIKPTTRTYSTMINAYSRISHSGDVSIEHELIPVKDLTHSRVTILFEQSQQHIKKCMTASSSLREDIGITPSSGTGIIPREPQDGLEDEINISPTNAYLKYLGRHGLWEDIYTTFLSMDTTGPLSPDTITYTTLFASLHHIHLVRSRQTKVDQKQINIGPISRGVWDQCYRQFSKTKGERDRSIDTDLFSHALRCLIKGRPEDQRFAIQLINDIWELPPPGQSKLASTSASTSHSITGNGIGTTIKQRPTVQSATSLIQGLSYTKQTVLAAHYTTLFLSIKEIQQSVDIHFLKSAISALSEIGDIGGIMGILDSYQPPTGVEGWDNQVYQYVLQGARWAGDFPNALKIFKRATQIGDIVEDTSPADKSLPEKGYEWVTPNGSMVDSRGIRWIRPKPIKPDINILSILLKISVGANNEAIKKVLNLINHFGGVRLFVIRPTPARPEKFHEARSQTEGKGTVLLVESTPQSLDINDKKSGVILGKMVDFARNIISAIERLHGSAADEYREMREGMQRVVRVWGGEVGKDRKGGGEGEYSDRREENESEWEDVEEFASDRRLYARRERDIEFRRNDQNGQGFIKRDRQASGSVRRKYDEASVIERSERDETGFSMRYTDKNEANQSVKKHGDDKGFRREDRPFGRRTDTGQRGRDGNDRFVSERRYDRSEPKSLDRDRDDRRVRRDRYGDAKPSELGKQPKKIGFGLKK